MGILMLFSIYIIRTGDISDLWSLSYWALVYQVICQYSQLTYIQDSVSRSVPPPPLQLLVLHVLQPTIMEHHAHNALWTGRITRSGRSTATARGAVRTQPNRWTVGQSAKRLPSFIHQNVLRQFHSAWARRWIFAVNFISIPTHHTLVILLHTSMRKMTHCQWATSDTCEMQHQQGLFPPDSLGSHTHLDNKFKDPMKWTLELSGKLQVPGKTVSLQWWPHAALGDVTENSSW